ncbi:MAG: glycosyltransferase family 4 protein [Bacteroidota bacterium]|nr:glycosyltransferase family 4 protein [Bacteroidota bacterium]
MKKVLILRRNPVSANDGTANYCIALHELYANDANIRVLDIKNYPTRHSFLFKYYYKYRPLKREIVDADIIHINGYTAMGTVQAMYWARQARKRVVYTAHWHPFENLSHPILGKIFFDTFVRRAIKKCVDIIVTINNEDFHFFSYTYPNTVRIPHWYKPKAISTDVARKSNMLLFIGRVDDKVKGIEHLYALQEGEFDIHCVGNGLLIERSDMTQHKNIPDSELIRLYAQAALVVIPSKYEAFSYVALEALSYGTPVVMSDRVRIADYLDDMKGYSVFHYSDMNDFYEKITNTIGTTVDKDRVNKIFSSINIKQCYDKVYTP